MTMNQWRHLSPLIPQFLLRLLQALPTFLHPKMGIPSFPCAIPFRCKHIRCTIFTAYLEILTVSFVAFHEGERPSNTPPFKASRVNASADDTFDALSQNIGYAHTPMTTVINPSMPVPQACLPPLGSKGNSVRPKGTRTIRELAKSLANRWYSDAEAAITYLANSPTMWHLVAPTYLDLVMKAGAMCKAKYAQRPYPPGRERPDHRM